MLFVNTLAAMAGALSLQTPVEDAQSRFEAFAEEFPSLNVAVSVEGETVFEAEGGIARTGADGLDTDYNFYSIAKLLTATAYARLEAEAGLDLDTAVRVIDPTLPDHYEAVTLRQLLNHRGGVRHYRGERDWRDFAERRCETPADALGHFIDDALIHEPGTEQQYTTFGYVLLSHLLLQITGTNSFDAAMTAALGDAYLAHTDRAGADKAANMFGNLSRMRVLENMSAECKFGGGGLLASARDLANMGEALARGEILALDALSDAIDTEEGPFGIAAGYSEINDVHYAAHSGGSPGGRAYLLVFIEPQIVVAVTSNYDGANHGEFALGMAELFSDLDLARDE